MRAHGLAGFGVLDDVDDLAAGIADDAAVGEWAAGDGGEQGQVGLLQTVAVEQAANGGGPEQRRIAIEDEQIALEAAQAAAAWRTA